MRNAALPLNSAVADDSKPAQPPPQPDPLEKAFASLATYDLGTSRGALVPIDIAVTAALGHDDQQQRLEQRLLAQLDSGVPLPAKEYVCRKLALIGSAASALPLAHLLQQPNLAEAARSVLEVLPGEEAERALRESLPELSGIQKLGVINSLGVRRDGQAVPALVTLMANSDEAVAAAAAAALGLIGNEKAAQALAAAESSAPKSVRSAILDGRLACAEKLLSAGQRAAALAIYRSLSGSEYPKPVQLAAKRGLLLSLERK
jgi:HEAT repeat protein